jgi:lipopolysaccharide export system protein LptC
MTPKRPALLDRLVSWSPVLFLGGLAALTYWLDAQVLSSGRPADGSSRHDPDLFIERFSAVTFGADGSVRQMLAASRADHFPDDGSVDLVAPVFEITDPGKPRLAVTASKGTVSGDRETVTLRGNVRATRDAAPAARPGESPVGAATFTTEMLRVIPKQQRAETDALVTIEEARGIISGVGMVLDNTARTVKLKSSVRGTLQPNKSAK